MVGSRFYDALYALHLEMWGSGPRPELVQLVEGGRVSAVSHPRALDLGCGTGQDTLFLARHGFEVTGIDFSRRALARAERRVRRADLSSRVRFVKGDLRDPHALGDAPTFDFLFDGGSLDDLKGADRAAAVANVHRWSHPGSKFLLWCFFGRPEELPRISFTGPSRLAPAFSVEEIEANFGAAFEIESFGHWSPRGRWACFLMTRRARPERPSS